MKCFLSSLAVLALAAASAPAQAPPGFVRVCEGGVCRLVPVSLPSPPPFAPVPAAAPQPMPCYAAGECPCSPCTCAAGACPGGCPTTTPAAFAPARVTYGRPYRFAPFGGRFRLFR